jgi:hypothetical protein
MELMRYGFKNSSKKPVTIALFEISCGFKGGKDLCYAGSRQNQFLSFKSKRDRMKNLNGEIEIHRFFGRSSE